MSTEAFLQKCQELVAQTGCSTAPPENSPELSEADSLIGLFQTFRPDGDQLEPLFQRVPFGDQLATRLMTVFEAAGDDRRPKGGRDVYFVVRSPRPMPVETAEYHAESWIEGLRSVAAAAGDSDSASVLERDVKIRVLEGIPPKHPKRDEERSELLKVFLGAGPKLTSRFDGVDPHAALLRPAYYFLACDAMLRDYLMWPFYAEVSGLSDPLRGYFQLWSHGVKYRIFTENQIDLYLPRETQQ